MQDEPRPPEHLAQETRERPGHLTELGEDQGLLLLGGDGLAQLAQPGPLAAVLLGLSLVFGSAAYGFDVELLSYNSYTSQMHNLIMAEEMYKAMGCTRDSDVRIPVATLDLLSASATTTGAQMVVTRGAGRPTVTFSSAYNEHKLTNLWSTANAFEFIIPSTAYYQPGNGVSQAGGVIYSADGKVHFSGIIAAEKTGTVTARNDLAVSQLSSGTANVTLISKDSTGASLRVSATGGTTQITLRGLGASMMYDLKVNSVKVESKMSDANGNVVFSRAFGSNDVAEVVPGQADSLPPQVQQVTPANAAVSVSVGSTVEIIFNEAMNKASVQGAFSLKAASQVSGTFTWFDSDRRLVFDPGAPGLYFCRDSYRPQQRNPGARR